MREKKIFFLLAKKKIFLCKKGIFFLPKKKMFLLRMTIIFFLCKGKIFFLHKKKLIFLATSYAKLIPFLLKKKTFCANSGVARVQLSGGGVDSRQPLGQLGGSLNLGMKGGQQIWSLGRPAWLAEAAAPNLGMSGFY